MRLLQKGKKKIPDCTGKMPQSNNEIENKKIKKILRDHNISKKIEINFNEHIRPQDFNITVTNLNLEQKSEIDELIEEYKHIFAKDKYDVGTVKDYDARIDLIIDKYCCKRPYRCTIADKKEIESQVSKLLEKK